MKRIMTLITIFLTVGFAVCLPIFAVTKNGVMEIVTISIGVTLYHFAMRLAVGAVAQAIMKNRANPESPWFREKSFESRLYKGMGVGRWKKHLPTYAPEIFDASQRTVEELVGATCLAEVVHEIIMLLSLLPIALILFFDGAAAFVITSALSMLFDGLFVMIQRYNRPRFVRLMKRKDRIKQEEPMIGDVK